MTGDEIAIVHKHYPVRGGAERVADELARTFDARVFTGYDNNASAEDVDVTELFGDSAIASIMRRGGMMAYLVRDAYYTVAWDYCPALTEFDVLVQSGTAPMWYVPPDDQVVVRYIHSTPRTPFDLFHEVGHSVFERAYAKAVRQLHSTTVPYADQYIANSELVAHRMQKYWGLDTEEIEVVYPPVDVSSYSARESTGDYYLTLSRLDHGKRIGEIIEAFGYSDEELLIAGDGPKRDEFEAMAADLDNVELLGYVSEERKHDLMANARAFVFNAANEDFGMVTVEAFAAGTPVIGVDDGFTKHQVQDGYSGVTFERGVANLRRAVEEFDGVTATAQELAAIAEQCSVDRFRREMRGIVDQARQDARIDAESWQSSTTGYREVDLATELESNDLLGGEQA